MLDKVRETIIDDDKFKLDIEWAYHEIDNKAIPIAHVEIKEGVIKNKTDYKELIEYIRYKIAIQHSKWGRVPVFSCLKDTDKRARKLDEALGMEFYKQHEDTVWMIYQ